MGNRNEIGPDFRGNFFNLHDVSLNEHLMRHVFPAEYVIPILKEINSKYSKISENIDSMLGMNIADQQIRYYSPKYL